jgi:hypothetical protein
VRRDRDRPRAGTADALAAIAMPVNAHVAHRFATAKNRTELASYFEYSSAGVEVVEDGLQEIGFGEYLVHHEVLTRYQLFRALQMQDRTPGVRLGECAAALGYAPIGAIEQAFKRFTQVGVVTVD